MLYRKNIFFPRMTILSLNKNISIEISKLLVSNKSSLGVEIRGLWKKNGKFSPKIHHVIIPCVVNNSQRLNHQNKDRNETY